MSVKGADYNEGERMENVTKRVQAAGGSTEDGFSTGEFRIDTNPVSREVWLRFTNESDGSEQSLNFTPNDWDAIVAAINEVELHRGKVVSTAWVGK